MTAKDFRTELGLITANNTLIANTATGEVGVNVSPTLCTLQIAANDAILIPPGNTAQRPSGSNGMIRYNGDLSRVEYYYTGGSWTPIGQEVFVQPVTFAATTTWNVAAGNFGTLTLTANTIMANTTSLSPGFYNLKVTQDGTGSRVVTSWGAQFKWPGGVAPVLTTNANAVDLITFVSDGTLMYGTYINNVK